MLKNREKIVVRQLALEGRMQVQELKKVEDHLGKGGGVLQGDRETRILLSVVLYFFINIHSELLVG
jgi:hypothetical protein